MDRLTFCSISFTIGSILILVACNTTDLKQEQTTKETFQELYRPQFHFTPPAQWMNDPNGMVFFEGEYHLFYQHYPDSNVWGPMHWGHAISEDMVHWEHLPIALYPDELGYIFSGSAVVDWNNTSGFGDGENIPLVAIYTYHDNTGESSGAVDFQTQGIAYSLDKGRSWEKYEGNPVIPNPGIKDFRDPKVIWHEASQKWVMILAVKDRIHLYHSPDLINWTFASEFGKNLGTHGGVWECPDLFELSVKGGEGSKWVMLVSINPGGPNGGSATQYFVGEFDGEVFTMDEGFVKEGAEEAVWMEYGRDNYAGVTWSDIPKEDGRRILLGWMSNWQYAQKVPTYVWRSAMTIPRELELHSTEAGNRLFSVPVKELDTLRASSVRNNEESLSGSLMLSNGGHPLMEVEVSFELQEGEEVEVGIMLTNDMGDVYKIGLNQKENTFFSDRTEAGKTDFSDAFASEVHLAPRLSSSNQVSMRLFLDVSSAELFADGGGTVLTDLFFPNSDFQEIRLYCKGGEVKNVSATTISLNPIWQ